MLILENGPTKTLTGHTYRQKARNSQIADIIVGTTSNITITIPEIFGTATIVVENVASIRNTINLSQLLLNCFGHLKNNP
jgi:hypothetical protein